MDNETFKIEAGTSEDTTRELIKLSPDMKLTVDLKLLYELAEANGWVKKNDPSL